VTQVLRFLRASWRWLAHLQHTGHTSKGVAA